MENNKYYFQFVDRLDVSQNAIEALKRNEINTLGALSNYKKSQLNNMGLLSTEIDKVEIELELLGLYPEKLFSKLPFSSLSLI